ncbi:hypothetical protein ABDE15_12520 [Staphylococcus epidermidis]|uniref:hypothetical protein n=1 Tax=Staphylococcus epidermidis TaxID=1282 RepID=UPI003204B78F
MAYSIKAETKKYSPTRWQLRYVINVCTLPNNAIAQKLDIPIGVILKWRTTKKSVSDDEIINKTKIKYINNLNKNFGALIDLEVRHLKRKLRLAENKNVVQKKQIDLMKQIVGKAKYKEIYQKAKEKVDSELPIWRKRHRVDVSKLKGKRGKSDD